MQKPSVRFSKYVHMHSSVLGVALCAAFLGAGCVATEGDGEDSERVSSQSDALTTSSYDWLQYFGDGRHLGNNTLETELTSADVAGLTQLFHVQPDTTTYTEGPPVILRSVVTASGTRDLAFIETRLGKLYALDARTGATVWSVTPTTTGSIFTTTTPAIDPGKAFVYMYGFDGKVHKYDVRNGTETTTGGWPEIVTLKPDVEKGITFLTYATDNTGTSYLYMGTSGYGDSSNDANGHLTAINLSTGAQKVFNAMCSTQTIHFAKGGCAMGHAAIWGRSVALYSPGTNRIYGGTGDGTFDPTNHYWGDTVLGLAPDGSGASGGPVDSYTPGVFAYLQAADYDLGASSPALLPNSGTKYPNIAVQAGKDNTLRIINLSNLSNSTGGAAAGHTGGELWSTVMDSTVDSNGQPHGTVDNGIVSWTNPADNSTWAFVPQERSLLAYKLALDASNNPSLVLQWSLTNPFYPGSAIVIANNVLYRAYSTNSGGTTGMLEARDPVTNLLLWSTSTGIGGIHWQSPVVANGILYLADNSGFVTAFALPQQSTTALTRTGWTATVGSNTSGEAPSNMFDGSTTTRWSTGTAQLNNGNQWVRVDMGGVRTINQITLDAATSGDYPRGYTFSVSSDGTTFTNLASGVGSALTTITFPTQSVRYFKVLQTGTVTPNWWSVYELNAYYTNGSAPLTAYPRTGWTASADYTNGADVPANAIDGDSASRWSDGKPQSTSPLPSPAPYFEINLGVSEPFTQITLDSAGSTGDYLRNYQVLAGNTDPPTTVIASGTATAALTTITLATSVTAQYIRVVQSAPATGVGSWWSVAEVNVWH